MLEIFLGVSQTTQGWIPRLKLRFKVSAGSMSDRCIFIAETLLEYFDLICMPSNISNPALSAEYQQSDVKVIIRIFCGILFFLNKQCIYSKSGLNGAHYKDVK